MKHDLKLLSAIAMATILSGCAGNREFIAKTAISSRQDVFRELQAGQTVDEKTMLAIEFPVKNYKTYFVNRYYKHTDPPYTAILNIDGQATVMSDDPVLEEMPGDFTKNPEAGTGWKYVFKKVLLLKPGKHRITVAVPLSDLVFEKEIELKEGANNLKFLPLYNASATRFPNTPRFSKGLREIRSILNKQEL